MKKKKKKRLRGDLIMFIRIYTMRQLLREESLNCQTKGWYNSAAES